jgi:transcriptional regulator with GAF, ATPase, and Fis domain
MTSAHIDRQATADRDRYQTLLSVSEAIVAHRDLRSLFHDLADRLHQVARFDFLALVLHEDASNTMRLYILETADPVPTGTVIVLPVDEDPAGLVWESQQPLITKGMEELKRWPRLLERVEPYGVQSYCWLPLTTARRKLGALVFTSKQPAAYDATDLPFLQQVANQVAVRTPLHSRKSKRLTKSCNRRRCTLKRRSAPRTSATSSAKVALCAPSSRRSRPLPRPNRPCSSAAKRAQARNLLPARCTT